MSIQGRFSTFQETDPNPNAVGLFRAEALRRVADALHVLAVTVDAPGPRLVSSAREPEVLLTVQEAAELLRCSVRHVERLIAGQPCRRKAGRKVLVERAGLLALTRRSQ